MVENIKQMKFLIAPTNRTVIGSNHKDGFLGRACPFTIVTPHHNHRLVFVIRFLDELELAMKIISKRAVPLRPLDQCHIFIQPHLLEWDDIFNSPAVRVALRETPMELHVYDHEARFLDFLNRIV